MVLIASRIEIYPLPNCPEEHIHSFVPTLHNYKKETKLCILTDNYDYAYANV